MTNRIDLAYSLSVITVKVAASNVDKPMSSHQTLDIKKPSKSRVFYINKVLVDIRSYMLLLRSRNHH